MVLPERIELSTSPLPRECSTTELRQRPGVPEIHEGGGLSKRVALFAVTGSLTGGGALGRFSPCQRKRRKSPSSAPQEGRPPPRGKSVLPWLCAPISAGAKPRRASARRPATAQMESLRPPNPLPQGGRGRSGSLRGNRRWLERHRPI